VGLRIFRRHRPAASPYRSPEGREELRRSVSRVVVTDATGAGRDAAAAVEEARAALRRIIAEALLMQDFAEDILEGVHAQRPLDELGRPGQVLVDRFAALKGQLPRGTGDPQLERRREVVARVLDHHAMMLAAALDLTAVSTRSERSGQQLERIDGLGAPAQWLRSVAAELDEEVEAAPVGERRQPG
jgi:hypothetical protein